MLHDLERSLVLFELRINGLGQLIGFGFLHQSLGQYE